MELKNEYTIKADQDIDDFDEEVEIEPLTKKKPPREKDNKDGRNGANKISEVNFFIKKYQNIKMSRIENLYFIF